MLGVTQFATQIRVDSGDIDHSRSTRWHFAPNSGSVEVRKRRADPMDEQTPATNGQQTPATDADGAVSDEQLEAATGGSIIPFPPLPPFPPFPG